MRYNVKRKMRNLEKAFTVGYFVWQDTDTLTSAMELLAGLHLRRWKKKGASSSFSSLQYNAFHQAVAHDFARKGWLHLSCLELNGEIVGMFYDYRYQGKIYYYQAGFDPDFSRYSPGLALRAYVIKRAIEEGLEEVDLLKGAYDFKYLWTPEDRSTTTLAVGRGTLGGRLHFLEAFEKPRMKAAIKEALPGPLVRLLR
jgi:CelD/BcsL family acetyltransferase involved in cellulose biosynthesis